MRMLVHAKLPHEPFNAAVRNGSVGKTIERILADAKPEAVYFTEYEGRRGAIMIVDVAVSPDEPRHRPRATPHASW